MVDYLRIMSSEVDGKSSSVVNTKDIFQFLKSRMHNHMELLLSLLLIVPLMIFMMTVATFNNIRPAQAATLNGTWSQGVQFGATSSPINSFSCVSSMCMAAGQASIAGQSNQSGVIFESQNSGSSWNALNIPAGAGPFKSISCATASVCVAVGSPLGLNGQGFDMFTANGGSSWSIGSGLSSSNTMLSVSCPSSTICYATSYDAIY